jgi:hypothetical protein
LRILVAKFLHVMFVLKNSAPKKTFISASAIGKKNNKWHQTWNSSVPKYNTR